VPWKHVEIVDDADEMLAPGQEGRIRIRGDDVADGYYVDRPDNKDIFRDGWFYPGDVGLVREDGMLVVTGRAIEIINRGGHKIAPSLVEGVLSLHPAIADTVVVGVPDARGIEEIWATIVRRSEVSEADLLQFCRVRLEPGKLPNHFIFVDAIPRNERGKPASDRLRQLIKEKSEH
jgi:long-chain acyl-CoA synthetase